MDALAEQYGVSPVSLATLIVTERSGRPDVAGTAIRRAIKSSPNDWHLWLVATRTESKQGLIGAALHSLPGPPRSIRVRRSSLAQFLFRQGKDVP